MKSIFKEKGLSQTPFRMDLLEVFQKHDSAIPVSTIEESLESFDRITLYRTIKKFIEKGIIHEIKIPGQDTNYALCLEECSSLEHSHQHIHFRCRSCEVISCISLENYPQISIPGYQVEQLEIQGTGLCDSCISIV